MKATFAAGCFWSIQLAFDKLEGVTQTKVGYSNGEIENPTYEQVCTDTTGHAEIVQVTYDTKKIKYEKLLETFWNIHDPTQGNRQGWDMGKQYRSGIFYHNQDQKKQAEASMKKQQEHNKKPITTIIEPVNNFTEAEEYHQKYLQKRCKNAC
ncbi:MAG: peptide-methionine (S)-S-oxide reductase MsrA [Nanoarchaeota archaeon]|nr:peptide-methionine (S)-S-oxide reductase MsrA [Nanoarchaeota archaeon]